ncbi:hypothetical protein SAMN05192558_109294 [Actinokineospora alba]|uniref:Uncharacterized protein n=1 Tax=Actinokineospora alba TaxID=504798 RepID=A0A1H0T6H8_9PSEU|nr:hypothetical protein [Actinokineospora alba]TDP66343.1 hypothetical protein C8E96_1847 [Actinokineospora alba]SDJ22479.1 hypothetical protein SAMN05421871_11181 [Actinokineospora alba]SDP49652.1 hypothetical protein SAMN05192558_109294 [Actinokineospora alba]
MSFPEDRGRVVRITFDIVYPTGQLKTVAMNMSDSDWGDTALIALSEEGIHDIVAPGLGVHIGAEAADGAVRAFDTKETDDAPFKPAMLIVANDGRIDPRCGAHGSVSHAEADNPIGRFI